MKSKKAKKTTVKTESKKIVTLIALLLALGAAIYLNWRFADTIPVTAENEQENDDERDENLGDALFVSANINNIDEYFASARLARSKSRDESLAALRRSLQDTELSELEKSELTAQLTAEAQSISLETAMESLIKAKGFYDCVVFVNSEGVKIVVAADEDGLSAAEVAKLMEIAVTQTDFDATKVSIVEVK